HFHTLTAAIAWSAPPSTADRSYLNRSGRRLAALVLRSASAGRRRFYRQPSALAVLRLMNSLNVVGCWKSGSQWTRRWREMDSNPRSPVRRTTLFETPLSQHARATAAFENARRPVQQLLLPVVDPVRMNAELTCQLSDRPV